MRRFLNTSCSHLRARGPEAALEFAEAIAGQPELSTELEFRLENQRCDP